MPCDTIQTIEVDLGKCNPTQMMEALKAMFFSPRLHSDGKRIMFGNDSRLNCSTGECRLDGNINVNEIKRAYSTQVVKSQAKRFGWSVKQQGNKLLIQKGAF